MEHVIQEIDGNLIVYLKGKFTISDSKLFTDIVSLLEAKNYSRMTLDLSEIQFIDSAALAKLLLLREKAQKVKAELILARPQGQVMHMLELSRFNELFSIAAA
jgi:HptB-dependent secretion and biofilm anti anti-sigma factor